MKLVKTFFIMALAMLSTQIAHAREQVVVSTSTTDLVFTVADDGRLCQTYLGKSLSDKYEYSRMPAGGEAYLTHGMEDYFTPALKISRSDGNPSTLLKYKGSVAKTITGGTETVISLADPAYHDAVDLHFVAYTKENVIKAWAEIYNNEKADITLDNYASSMLRFNAPRYFLTQYSGDWAKEVQMDTQELFFGKKVVDTKLGTRADMIVSPFFQLSLGEPATEQDGQVLVGTLAWTGNFRFTFEVDQLGELRVLSGINPAASSYNVRSGESFRTPEFIFTLSQEGTGRASRDLHDWARQYQIKDGTGDRMTLLNNWEATYFDFDEGKIISLIKQAKDLGVDLFLLDDGWFGNKYPRTGDNQGLGDWEETTTKLPDGIGRLTDEANKQGIKFGLWIEPEMVNPKSELFERHKDWAILLPNREPYYFRNQLVLDLTNPKVQDYVFGIIDKLRTKYPGIAYFKWDCNSPITNIYSNYEGKRQSRLYVDYVRGLYKVLDRVKAKYPDLPMMLCSGGGGRTDYEGLRYFTEMWVSDNTDPVERLFIQWGYSQVFPAKVQCAHVTSWNKDASMKFRVDVAMMGKLGFDLNLSELSPADFGFCEQSITCYNQLKPVILNGDQYRLVSPYNGNHAATMYVGKDKHKAMVFAFDVYPRYGEKTFNVKLQGLTPNGHYSIREVNRMDGKALDIGTYSGDYLMIVGLPVFTSDKLTSHVYEVELASI